MRFGLVLALVCAPAVASGFEPGSLGDDYRDKGYIQGCSDTGELPGCTIIAGGSQFVIRADGPTPAGVMAKLRALPKLAYVDFRGDLLNVFDSYAELALGSVRKSATPDAYGDVVAAMQGDWVSVDDPAAAVVVDGLIWTDVYDGAEVARSVAFVGQDCAEGPTGERMLEVFQTGSAEVVSFCYAIVAIDADRMELVYLARGNTLVFGRP